MRMDGISVSVDISTIGILLFIMYKIIQLDMRLRKIEKIIINGENESK